MKKLFAITCSLLVIAGAASAQWVPGSIDVMADIGATTCNITDAGGVLSVYVFHTNTNGSTLTRFRVQPSAGVTLTWLADNVSPYFGIGDSQNGIAIAYGACLSNFPGPILTMTYLAAGNTPACETLRILEDPGSLSGQVEFIDCTLPIPLKFTVPMAGTGIVNNDGSCVCNIPVRDTTWGRVKALYN